jgi:hypothetical protein
VGQHLHVSLKAVEKHASCSYCSNPAHSSPRHVKGRLSSLSRARASYWVGATAERTVPFAIEQAASARRSAACEAVSVQVSHLPAPIISQSFFR